MSKPILCSTAFAVLFFVSCTKDNPQTNKVPIVDAGDYRTIFFPDTVHLQGSASDTDGNIVGYLWSQLDGPAETSFLNPADSVTAVSFPSTGTYRFQLMAVDNEGATGLDTVSVLVKAKPIDTLTLQPANNPANVMIWGNLTGLDQSWNQSPEAGAAAWTSGQAIWERSAFKFDLSGISPTATIVSATLSLYSEVVPLNGNLVDANYGNNAMLIREITGAWNPLTANWANQPATTTTHQTLVPATTQSRLDIDADVTDIVAHQVSTQTNYGFMIQLQNEVAYASRLFYSSYSPDAAKHPKLVIIVKN